MPSERAITEIETPIVSITQPPTDPQPQPTPSPDQLAQLMSLLQAQQQSPVSQPNGQLNWKHYTGGGGVAGLILTVLIGYQEYRRAYPPTPTDGTTSATSKPIDSQELAKELAPLVAEKIDATWDVKIEKVTKQLRKEAEGEKRLFEQQREAERQKIQNIYEQLDRIETWQKGHDWRHSERRRSPPGAPVP